MVGVNLRDEGPQRIGTVYCLGRNYAAHAAEMGARPEPVVFIKPATAVRPGGGRIAWPAGTELVHHEVELVLLLAGGGQNLAPGAAAAAIAGIGLGVDLTARDLQGAAKKAGAPWARSKGFPGSAPVSDFLPVAALTVGWGEIDLALEVAGEQRQQGTSAAMLLSPPEIVSQLSRWFELAPGDLVFTGTPEGVGPLAPGQPVVARSAALGLTLELELHRG
jgi:fumarylpyruvate hydrolase